MQIIITIPDAVIPRVREATGGALGCHPHHLQ